MATPLDPDRWSDFASPKPPTPAPARASSAQRTSAAGTDGQRWWQIGDVLESLTLGGVVSFVVQSAQSSSSGADSDTGGRSGREMAAHELRTISVGGDGRIDWPVGKTVRCDVLLELLREVTLEQSLPPVVARTILARPAPSLDRMVDLLAEFANIGELAAGARREEKGSSPTQPSPAARRRLITAATSALPATALPATAGPPTTAAPPRRYVVAGGAVALGLLTIVAVLAGGASASPQASVAPSPANSNVDPVATGTGDPRALGTGDPRALGTGAPISWAGVLAELDRQRQQYFAAGDTASLAAYAKSGSPAQARDSAAQRELRALGARASGMVSKIVTVKSVAVNTDVAELDVTDELSGYQIVRIDTGAVIETRPARPVATWRVNLERVGERWQLVDSRAV